MSGYQANATNSRRSRAKRRGGRYFVLRPDTTGGRAGVAPGIYWRKGLKELVPVIMFVRAPGYKARFPFYEVARSVFNDRMIGHARAGYERFVVAPLKRTF
jgi:hypothetical protein